MSSGRSLTKTEWSSLEGGKLPGFDPNFSSGRSRPLLLLRLRSRLGGLRSRLGDRLLLYDRGIFYILFESGVPGLFLKKKSSEQSVSST